MSNYTGIGNNGGKIITGTSETAPSGATTFAAIRTITATVITAAPGNLTGVAGPTYPANFLIEGRFKSITLASGSVIAYNAHN